MSDYLPKVILGDINDFAANNFTENMLFVLLSDSLINATEKAKPSLNHDVSIAGSVLQVRGKASTMY